jgi:HPt (histidine-containing phosphotransfer) domain-containing protein
MMSDPDFERDFAQLRERYRPKLLADMETLERHLRGGGLEEALQLAHRLKGTAGTYGLDDSSAALDRIETLLRSCVASALASPTDEVSRQIREALARARSGAA